MVTRGNIVDYLFEHRRAPAEARRTYLITPDGRFSFADLYARMSKVAHLFRTLGVRPGDRMMFSVRDGIDFPALFLGAMKIGAVSVPLNTFLKPVDYAYYIRDSGARIVVADQGLAAMIQDVVRDASTVEHVFVAGGPAAGLPTLASAIDPMPDDIETCPRSAEDMAFWLYSSGSTGDPKGVVHTHDHIRWATELFGIGTQGISRDDVILCPPKMFFAFGLGNQVYFPLRAGAQVLVDPEPIKPERVVALLLEHQPTLLIGVPTLYAAMATLMRSMDRNAVRDAFRRMRFCVSGGEVLPPSLQRDWHELTGVEILDGIGTTEMLHMFVINRPGQAVPGSCGRIVDGYTARLVDDEWNDVPEGEIGNLFVVGPTAAREYWNKPEKTKATMREGGVLTGDKCYRDREGNLFYVGRNDDMLRVGGIWVSPAEVESALAEHPAVLECAVIGAPDEHGLIKAKAFVVLRSGASGTPALAEEMRLRLRDRLAHYKCPRWIAFVPELPKTATGKIQRFRLREAEAAPAT